MDAPPAGISGADWLATPVAVRALILAEQEEIEQLRTQLTALATELSSLRERIGRSSRNSSKPPSSDGSGFKPPERRKGSGRKLADGHKSEKRCDRTSLSLLGGQGAMRRWGCSDQTNTLWFLTPDSMLS